jgi:hypothetical protein
VDKYPALESALTFCITNDIQIPDDLLEDLRATGIKTEAYYESQLTRLVKSFYKGNMDALEFVMVFENMITGQLTKAWLEGLETNGLTSEDMTDEWKVILDDIITAEKESVSGFANDIESASMLTGEPIDPLLARVPLWALRYEDTKNRAIMATAEEKTKLEWIYGDTEHCETCAQLNGIVAYSREWDESGIRPQNPPNGMLTCGGWRCQCRLEPTDKRKTVNAYDKLLAIGLGQ